MKEGRWFQRTLAMVCLAALLSTAALGEEGELPGVILLSDPVPDQQVSLLHFAEEAVRNADGADGTGVFVDDSQNYADIRAVFPEEENEASKIIINFLGDCTLACGETEHGNDNTIEAYVGRYGADYPFYRVQHILEQDDLTVANFEGTLHNTNDGYYTVPQKTYSFRGDESMVEVLKAGSVEVVSLANNHIGDYGVPGYEDTVRVLNGNGIPWFACSEYGSQTYVFEKDGIRIGFISAYISFFWNNLGVIQKAMDELKSQNCNAIIGIMHGGVEYDKRHDDYQLGLARAFIRYGADLVIGHHPHCLQGYGVVEGVPVYYSLGNFVFGGNSRLNTTRKGIAKSVKYTMILTYALSFDEDGKFLGSRANLIPCRLSEDETVNQYQPYAVLGADGTAAIDEVLYDTKAPYLLHAYQEGIGALQDFVPAK